MKSDESPKATSVRTFELMWGVREQSSRGPKQGLTIEAIVRTAIELADAEGLTALSMRKVAERLGVGAMTLYTYVPGKDELIALMIDAVMSERPDRRDAEGDWRARLELVARDGWDLCHRHMWLVDVGSERNLVGPGQMDAYESELSAIAGIGLTPTEMVSVISLVTGFVGGAVRGAVQVIQEERRTGLTRDQWWEQIAPVFDKYIAYERYPTVMSTGEAESHADGPKEAFEFGLARVLDGIEVLIRSRR
ncbi:TetR/AcrR family transcriptional regulator [Phytomonospora endophytica]|uniref:AcrR family transcriptional regulator n=1 Tax=Phytomonospora endophytica TaxID=714109 RepID=A0A841FB88_9ACTN|nr:TetR/AcrR family transcriptional regulator [Phytomonospora endophytica]MBB6033516.1 AcrR family transcriptional regulator [Phytomonospora endophytica]GIG64967.1 TetR family transcriptional regulator [Phytomonospora endophytica]